MAAEWWVSVFAVITVSLSGSAGLFMKSPPNKSMFLIQMSHKYRQTHLLTVYRLETHSGYRWMHEPSTPVLELLKMDLW